MLKTRKNTNGYILISIIVACLLLYGALFFLFNRVELCADDFNYSTFLRDGFSSFVQKNIEHYKTFNGRVWIHIADQIILYFGVTAYALFTVVILALMPLVVWKLDKNGETPLVMTALFPIFLMTVGVNVLREGLFWISGSFNYVLPFFAVLCAMLIAKRQADGSTRAGIFALFCAAAFICGAANEQCGLMSVFVFIYFSVSAGVKRRRVPIGNIVLSAISAAGYATVFLSPATFSRLISENYVGIKTWLEKPFDMADMIFGSDGMFYVAMAFLISVFLYSLILKEERKKYFVHIAAGAVAVVFFVLKLIDGRAAHFIMLALFLIYLIALAVSMIKYSSETIALVIICGMGSLCVMFFTNSAEPRTALPFSLSLCLAGAYFLAAAQKKMNTAGRVALLLVFFALGAALFAPTYIGYMKNSKIRDRNLEAIKESERTGEFFYNIDYDRKYIHLPMYSDGYFYNTFIQMYRLEGVDIYFCSDIMKPVFVSEKRLASLAYIYNGEVYFPAENIVTALGGSCSWTPANTVFSLCGNEIEVVSNTLYVGNESVDISDKTARGYMYICYTEEIFEKYFGIMIDYNEENGFYTASFAK